MLSTVCACPVDPAADAGAAVLAVGHNEQDQLVMCLWRQVAEAHPQQHQCNPWLQLPALPSLRSSTQGMQQAAAASSTHAIFVQHQFGGLQLYVAHTVTHTAGEQAHSYWLWLHCVLAAVSVSSNMHRGTFTRVDSAPASLAH